MCGLDRSSTTLRVSVLGRQVVVYGSGDLFGPFRVGRPIDRGRGGFVHSSAVLRVVQSLSNIGDERRIRSAKGPVVELSPADIRSQSFRAVIRGYDPQQVNAVLAAAAKALEVAHAELAAAARSKAPTDEAIKLTMMSAVRAKEDMMSSANLEVEALRRAAQDEAEGLIAAAQRDAEAITTKTKRSADQMVTRAHDEVASLELRIEQLKAVVRRTENLMKGMASGALGDLAHAAAMLAEDEPDDDGSWAEPQLQVVVSGADTSADNADNGSPGQREMLPEAVDRLLNQLREIT